MRVVHQSCWAASSTAQHSYVGQLTKQFEPGKEPEAKGSSGGLEGAPHDVMVSRREPSTLERRAKHVFHKVSPESIPADLDFDPKSDLEAEFEPVHDSPTNPDSPPISVAGLEACFEVDSGEVGNTGSGLPDGRRGVTSEVHSGVGEHAGVSQHSGVVAGVQNGSVDSCKEVQGQYDLEKVEELLEEWYFAGNHTLTRTYRPVVSELSRVFRKSVDVSDSDSDSDSVESHTSESDSKFDLGSFHGFDLHLSQKEPGSPKPAETSDLDFSVLQRSEQLNVDVTKQRISLRQKGSLAKRRRPTRNSMRSRGSSDGDLYEDSTEPKRTPRRIASHRTDEEEEEEDEDEPVFRPAPVHSNLEGKITPILLPGLAETSRPLRKSRPPVPLPKTRHASGPTDKVRGSPTTPSNGAGVPPWMSGMKIRRSSQTPIKVVLENTKDCEPQTPPWLKDVLIKKKRPSDIPEKRASQQPAETEEPATPPWMKERALRMSNRPSLQKTIQKDVANNNNANVQPASMEDDTLNKCSSPLIIDYDSSRPSWLTNSESLRSRGREILAPIKRSGSTVNNVYSEGSDENTPPPEGSVSSRTSSVENTPQKHILPPLNTSPSLAHSGQENSETAVPAWRIEIAARRKSKTFVPVHKPESPLRLGETPVWKRELSERNKVKKRGSMEGNPSSEAVTDAASPTLPPWKAELAQRKRRPPNINRETLEKSSTDEPEWTKNVELRRARLANVGLIDHTTEGSSR